MKWLHSTFIKVTPVLNCWCPKSFQVSLWFADKSLHCFVCTFARLCDGWRLADYFLLPYILLFLLAPFLLQKLPPHSAVEPWPSQCPAWNSVLFFKNLTYTSVCSHTHTHIHTLLSVALVGDYFRKCYNDNLLLFFVFFVLVLSMTTMLIYLPVAHIHTHMFIPQPCGS